MLSIALTAQIGISGVVWGSVIAFTVFTLVPMALYHAAAPRSHGGLMEWRSQRCRSRITSPAVPPGSAEAGVSVSPIAVQGVPPTQTVSCGRGRGGTARGQAPRYDKTGKGLAAPFRNLGR